MIRDGEAWRDADFAPWMITLPVGEFIMGASEGDKFADDTERPAHVVIVATFACSRAPVTVGELRTFRPSHSASDDAAWPVACVSWEEAAAYCAWLSRETGRAYRLPREAEWEYACRAGTRTPFATGEELTPDDANYFYREDGARVGPGRRTPIDMYPANTFGLHDLHGNVCEWTADEWRPNYATATGDAARRAIRGCGWDYLPRLLRSAWRDGLPLDTRRDNLGFRLALTLSE